MIKGCPTLFPPDWTTELLTHAQRSVTGIGMGLACSTQTHHRLSFSSKNFHHSTRLTDSFGRTDPIGAG